jgi:hypothetical protein
VSDACTSFRRALERALEGRASQDVRVLSWHEHLLGCADCRALLEAEEALEELLGSLPEPRLPAELAERVLARLRADRTSAGASEGALDRLLGLADAAPPADLAARVLAGLGRETAGAPLDSDPLDRLLERWEVSAPPALAAAVLARVAARPRARPRLVSARRALLALAAGLVVALGGWAVWRATSSPAPRDLELAEAAESAQGDPPPDLLANLDLFVEWDELVDADVELLLGTLDADELALLELAGEMPPGELPGEGAAKEGGGG